MKSLTDFINESRGKETNITEGKYNATDCVSDFTPSKNLIQKIGKKGRDIVNVQIDNSQPPTSDKYVINLGCHLSACPEEWQESDWSSTTKDFAYNRKFYNFTSTNQKDGETLVLKLSSGEVAEHIYNVSFTSDFPLIIRGYGFSGCTFEGPITVVNTNKEFWEDNQLKNGAKMGSIQDIKAIIKEFRGAE